MLTVICSVSYAVGPDEAVRVLSDEEAVLSADDQPWIGERVDDESDPNAEPNQFPWFISEHLPGKRFPEFMLVGAAPSYVTLDERPTLQINSKVKSVKLRDKYLDQEGRPLLTFGEHGFGPELPESSQRLAVFERWQRTGGAEFDWDTFNYTGPEQHVDIFGAPFQLVMSHLHPTLPRFTASIPNFPVLVEIESGGVPVPTLCDTVMMSFEGDDCIVSCTWRAQMTLSGHRTHERAIVLFNNHRVAAVALGANIPLEHRIARIDTATVPLPSFERLPALLRPTSGPRPTTHPPPARVVATTEPRGDVSPLPQAAAPAEVRPTAIALESAPPPNGVRPSLLETPAARDDDHAIRPFRSTYETNRSRYATSDDGPTFDVDEKFRRIEEGQAIANSPLTSNPPSADIEAVRRGAGEASDAAARSIASPTRAATRAPAPRAVRPARCVELLWFDSTLPGQIEARWPDLARELSFQPMDPRHDLPSADRDAVMQHHCVAGALAEQRSSDLETIQTEVRESISERGRFTPPLVLVEGKLTLPFDELATLGATAAVLTPMVRDDSALKEALRSIGEMLKDPYLRSSTGIAGNLIKHIVADFGTSVKASRSTAVPDREEQVRRILRRQRAYQHRSVFGDDYLRGTLDVGGRGELLVYLPKLLERRVPMVSDLRVALIGEVHQKQDEDEAGVIALKTLAVSRAISDRRLI